MFLDISLVVGSYLQNAHICVSFARFIDAVSKEFPGRGLKRQLQLLCKIYALSVLSANAGDFLVTGCLNGEQVSLAKEQLRALYREVRMYFFPRAYMFPHILSS